MRSCSIIIAWVVLAGGPMDDLKVAKTQHGHRLEKHFGGLIAVSEM